MKPTLDLSVYLVTDPVLCAARGVIDTAVAAVRGGVRVVQLRDKQASDVELIRQGRALKQALTGSGALLIINDRLEVAAAVGADGLHIGQDDGDAQAARERLGDQAIIGRSIQTPEHAAAVERDSVDYVGIGPVFATGTKPDHSRPLGFDGLARMCALSPVPVVAIGGLGMPHCQSVFQAGAQGLAVVSAICGAPDPEAAARALVEAARSAGSAGRPAPPFSMAD
ncbi:thiamine phosphate synthase [Thiohalocapsa marina]|uniref:thiamine phosphate synthase n=1 Tax=Thiohalocapsa marina TaxID=424902 RepID=UPI001B871446|nr:thiamine phosphate synthase [Thiohalocapsa marina]